MALIVETGTGSATAESFASVADADAYHLARGNSTWAALATGPKEIALRKATDFMGQRYAGDWSGERVYSTQALDWPRANVCRDGFILSSATVPAEVIRACCELALKASTTALTVDEGAQVVSETVGEISVSYALGARQQTRYAAVDNILRQLLGGGSRGAIRLVRS